MGYYLPIDRVSIKIKFMVIFTILLMMMTPVQGADDPIKNKTFQGVVHGLTGPNDNWKLPETSEGGDSNHKCPDEALYNINTGEYNEPGMNPNDPNVVWTPTIENALVGYGVAMGRLCTLKQIVSYDRHITISLWAKRGSSTAIGSFHFKFTFKKSDGGLVNIKSDPMEPDSTSWDLFSFDTSTISESDLVEITGIEIVMIDDTTSAYLHIDELGVEEGEEITEDDSSGGGGSGCPPVCLESIDPTN